MEKGSTVKDPLAGMRLSIAEKTIKVLRWPADEPCPVEKGEKFEVRGAVIEIETINRKIVKGAPAEWHATFIRHEPDRVHLLRQNPPVHAGSEKDLDIALPAAERARRDGNYTSSRVSAMPMEPESVGPDWIDPRSAERSLLHKEARKDLERERMEQAAKSRLNRILKGLPADQAQHMLIQIEALCQQAEEKTAA
jgi:hypothetical protein